MQIQKANSSCRIKAHLRIAEEQGMPKTGQTNFTISPRSPDINPIENILNHVKCKLGNDTIEHKTFDELSKRVKMTLESYCIRKIDRTIEPVNKCIGMIIKSKGQRTKYRPIYKTILIPYVRKVQFLRPTTVQSLNI